MQFGGIHPDVDVMAHTVVLPTSVDSVDETVAELAADVVARSSIAGIAAEIDELCGRLEELVPAFAALVRDGSSTDLAHGPAACDAMSAAGRLTGVAAALGSVAFTRMDDTAAHLEDAVRNPGTWAAFHAGLSNAEVGVTRRVSRCLSRYPRIANAFLSGTLRAWHLCAIDAIIPSHVGGGEVMAQWVGAVFEIQEELLDAAALCESERGFRRFCAAVRDRLDVDGPAPIAHEASRIDLRESANGRWSLFGDLSADDGAILVTLVDEQMRREHDARKAAGDHEADELVPYAVRRAEALLHLLRDGAGASKPGRVGLFLHLDLGDLVALGGVRPPAHTEAAYDISDDTLWALLAGADVIPVITDDGTPLSYGRTRRIVPEILRHILAHRDQTCCFPGCEGSAIWYQQHHLERWIDGGDSDPENCRGTCRFHHSMHHGADWGLDPPDPDHPGAPGPYRVTRPDGTPHDPTPRWSRRARERDPYRRIARARLDELCGMNSAAA